MQAPLTGQDRLTLEEGLRDEDLRKFWLQGDHSALRPGLTDGERILLGAFGSVATNRFNAATLADAESARDVYGVANPTWLDGYRANTTLLIQLYGFGDPVYQSYDETDGHWVQSRRVPGRANEPLGRVHRSDGRQTRPRELSNDLLAG